MIDLKNIMIFGYPYHSGIQKSWGLKLNPYINEYRIFIPNDRGCFIGLSLYQADAYDSPFITITEVDARPDGIKQTFRNWAKPNLTILLLLLHAFYMTRINSGV
jgi:hypothetical protein